MPYAVTKDNVKLYYEETGSGFPLTALWIISGISFSGNWYGP